MKRSLACLAAFAIAAVAPTARAATQYDELQTPAPTAVQAASGPESLAPAAPSPLGALIAKTAPAQAAVAGAAHILTARLYHAGSRGMRALDSLGCKVSAMRTLAVDPHVIPRRTVVFIKETVGMMMPDGGVHDGYWYASDIGGGIKGAMIDLFTGADAGSMKPFMARRLNVAALTVASVGSFKGCPPLQG